MWRAFIGAMELAAVLALGFCLYCSQYPGSSTGGYALTNHHDAADDKGLPAHDSEIYWGAGSVFTTPPEMSKVFQADF
jgi:hypothetical protein